MAKFSVELTMLLLHGVYLILCRKVPTIKISRRLLQHSARQKEYLHYTCKKVFSPGLKSFINL